MDPENNKRNFGESIAKGVIEKSASVENQEVTEAELRQINKFTLTPLNADEVFTFKIVMGDNEIDDRNYEPFNLNALKDLKKLYVGKTVIKDHSRSANNQIARIYDTELVQDEPTKLTGAGEIYTKLIAKCYMVKTASNADLIQEIKAGIKKEVSTGCKPKHAYCSICGVDNTKDYCSHWWGKEYETVNGKKLCYFTLDGAKDAYEVSFVAVPAQPRAGTTKNYCEDKTKEQKPDEDIVQDENTGNDNVDEKEKEINLEKELNLRCKMLDSFLFLENQKEKEGN
jgi:hypothetical protein